MPMASGMGMLTRMLVMQMVVVVTMMSTALIIMMVVVVMMMPVMMAMHSRGDDGLLFSRNFSKKGNMVQKGQDQGCVEVQTFRLRRCEFLLRLRSS